MGQLQDGLRYDLGLAVGLGQAVVEVPLEGLLVELVDLLELVLLVFGHGFVVVVRVLGVLVLALVFLILLLLVQVHVFALLLLPFAHISLKLLPSSVALLFILLHLLKQGLVLACPPLEVPVHDPLELLAVLDLDILHVLLEGQLLVLLVDIDGVVY